jgi:hypothetical protein
MKVTKYLIGTGAILLLTIAIWWFTGNNSGTVREKAMSAAEPVNGETGRTPAGPPALPNVPSPAPTKPTLQNALERLAQFKAGWDEENSKSLEFYGKVVDQDGQPVVGAKIQGNVMTTVGFQGTNETPHFTTTDQDGNFEFRGLHGQSLGVAPEKRGCKYTQRGNGNWTPSYKASKENPVIFYMWKIKGAEPMIHTVIRTGLACDGSPSTFNFFSKHMDVTGLTIKLLRNPVNIDRRKRFDWTSSLSMSGGGLISTNDIYPDEAPADGYKDIIIDMPAASKDWTRSFVQSYYFFDGQHYGRVTVDIMTNYQPPPTSLELDAYVNPSGSRNLEFDPAKEIQER